MLIPRNARQIVSFSLHASSFHSPLNTSQDYKPRRSTRPNRDVPILTAAEMATENGSSSSSGVVSYLWAFFWGFILVLLSFEIAFICAFWYIIFLPFTICAESLTGLTDIFLRGIQLPHFCADNMIHKRTITEAIRLIAPIS